MKYKMIFAGSGGQGNLLVGQIIAYAAMHEGKEVTYLPSYGPEMRGGTANCTVVVSDKSIACPIVNEADMILAMNLPSLDKFENTVVPGGHLFINSSTVGKSSDRSDINVHDIAANDIAKELGNEKCANIVILGAIVNATKVVSKESVEYILEHKAFTGAKAKLLPINLEALHVYLKD
ncbi:MAG: 2-oxoacid:ferredoxin oxidoreductase subunit gamma [Ruminococcaceae bacterium]|nr:2-oxoacid:ferredoxin oxidoreductase subunit gamma [Oscillospiraceae bacterium]